MSTPRAASRRLVLAASLSIALVSLLPALRADAQEVRCPFSTSARSFLGTPTEQARCLLRPVRRLGNVGPRRATLPAPLDQLDRPIGIDRARLARFLSARGINPAALGGDFSTAVTAKYLVIHDTSSPLLPFVSNDPAVAEVFPPVIDTAEWTGNRLVGRSDADRAHMYVNRLGRGITTLDFSLPRRATKFETRILGAAGRGLFVHVEMIQPRRPNRRGIDEFSPRGGFTDAALERLALVFITASVRRGQWMIPAFHCVLDVGIPDAHDDPQNFDLDRWAAKLNALLTEIRALP